MFVVSEDEPGDIVIPDAALAAAPPGVALGGALLPRRRVEDPCRICGRHELLTREHVPPRSAGNRQTARAHTIEEWLARESLDEVPGGRTEQGGVWGYTLCGSCNSRTGSLYGSEYGAWASRAGALLRQVRPPQLDRELQSRGLTIQFDEVRPGAFARQVLSLMCSLAGPWRLTDQHTNLRPIILDGVTGHLPDGMALDMTLCAGPAVFLAGPSLHVDRKTGGWRWMSVLAYPPLAFEMTLAADGTDTRPLCGIANFLDCDIAVQGSVELDVFVGFTHTMFPGDWRTRAQVEAGVSLYGS
jgi:hypothetical protein